jgi:hypothetical protein
MASTILVARCGLQCGFGRDFPDARSRTPAIQDEGLPEPQLPRTRPWRCCLDRRHSQPTVRIATIAAQTASVHQSIEL